MTPQFKTNLLAFVAKYDEHHALVIAAAKAEQARKDAEEKSRIALAKLTTALTADYKASRNGQLRLPSYYNLPDGRIASVQDTGVFIHPAEPVEGEGK